VTRHSPLMRTLLALAVALCTTATLLSTSSDTAPQLELAADTNQFDPGNIISDAMFFDPNALTAGQIADFIAAKGAACQWGSDGSPCLKNFRQDTFTRAADGICDNAYWGAAGESAAMIIWKVAQACNVSSKVLLVLLQKEQALVTTTNPTARRYEIAAGMGCPDTAACDTQYYGFYNQVYAAARQYQRYATYPTKYSYRAGVNNTILWSPNAACGTSVVYIQNQATAGLYNYTPYRPNAAALRAGYGTGDGCSAYGNRNFWLYFTDWFGSTQSPGGDAILASYAARGGAAGPLGPWTTWVVCGLAGGGCGQTFQNGTLYWSAATGTQAVTEPVLSAWGGQRERGPLGYPTTDMFCGLRDSGCAQAFQGGRVFTAPTAGTHAVTEPVLRSWIEQGLEKGVLGYPISDLFCGLRDSGCAQAFQDGRIYTAPSTGTHALAGPVNTVFEQQGLERGPLGLPISPQYCGLKESGCVQAFQGGRIYTTPGTGAHPLTGAIHTAWEQQGYERGPLGYATGDQVCGLADGGCKQAFQGGTLISHPTAGARPVSGAIATAWAAAGAEAGALGYPTSPQYCGLKESGCVQAFQGGRIYTTPGTGTHPLTGPIHTAWAQQGYERGPLGYPTSDPYAVAGRTAQTFQGGTLTHDSGTGQVTRS
jgi:uncharacterized protein with LGFP repeats